MEQDSIDRIRSATFNLARRGYDRREVDQFLQRLADWLEGGGEGQAQSEVVQRELERIGQHTAKILTAAGEAAGALKADAENEAREAVDDARIQANAARVEADRYAEATRGEADEYAEATRGKADAYAHEKRQTADAYDEQTRTDADAYAGQTREAAEEHAKEMLDEAKRRAEQTVGAAKTKADSLVAEGRERHENLQQVIADLTERRDMLVDELETIAGSLHGTASQHRQQPTREMAAGNGESRSEEPAETS